MEIIIGMCTAAFILSIVVYLSDKKEASYDRISFAETLNLTDLPIITFFVDGSKYNFMLDSGANLSVINESCLPSIKHTMIEGNGTAFGVDGNPVNVEFAKIDLTYKDNTYEEMFQVMNLDVAFGNIKKDSGATIHGIIGNAFFQKYKYVLDFDKLVAYSRL